MKICKSCGLEKPLDDYHKHKGNRDGYRGSCRDCLRDYRNEQKRLYYQRHAERINAERSATRAADPERYRQIDKRYHQKHRERRLESHRRWYYANHAAVLQRKRAAYWTNPDLFRQRALHDRLRHRDKRIQADRDYYWRNRDWILKKGRKRRQRDPEHIRLLELGSRLRNRENKLRRDRDYYRRHREKILERNSERRKKAPIRLDRSDGKPTTRIADLYIWNQQQYQTSARESAGEILELTMQGLTEAERRFLLCFESNEYEIAATARDLHISGIEAQHTLESIRNVAHRARRVAIDL